MGIGNGAPAWPSVIISNGGISPSDHKGGQKEYNSRRRGGHTTSYDLVSVNTFQCRTAVATPSPFAQIGQSPL